MRPVIHSHPSTVPIFEVNAVSRVVEGSSASCGLGSPVGVGSGEPRPETKTIYTLFQIASYVVCAVCVLFIQGCSDRSSGLPEDEQRRLDAIAQAIHKTEEPPTVAVARHEGVPDGVVDSVQAAEPPTTGAIPSFVERPHEISFEVYTQKLSEVETELLTRWIQSIPRWSDGQGKGEYAFVDFAIQQGGTFGNEPRTIFHGEIRSLRDLRLFADSAHSASVDFESCLPLIKFRPRYKRVRSVTAVTRPDSPPAWYYGNARTVRGVLWEAFLLGADRTRQPPSNAAPWLDFEARDASNRIYLEQGPKVRDYRGKPVSLKSVLRRVHPAYRHNSYVCGETGMQSFVRAAVELANLRQGEGIEQWSFTAYDWRGAAVDPQWAPNGLHEYAKDYALEAYGELQEAERAKSRAERERLAKQDEREKNSPAARNRAFQEALAAKQREPATSTAKLWLRPTNPQASTVNARYEVHVHRVPGVQVVYDSSSSRRKFAIEVDDEKALKALMKYLGEKSPRLRDRLYQDFTPERKGGGTPPTWGARAPSSSK